MRHGIDFIDKSNFLISYNQARTETYLPDTIRNGFKATGLVLYDPIWVLLTLQVERKTSTPPSSSHGSHLSSWTPKTPRTLRQFKYQSRTVEEYLKRHTKSPESPIKQALGQLIKGCHLAIHNATLLADENAALRIANQKQRQKRSKPASSISQGGILTVQEGQVRTQSVRNVGEGGEGQFAAQPKTRAPRKCSLCSSLEHTARTCVLRYSNNQ